MALSRKLSITMRSTRTYSKCRLCTRRNKNESEIMIVSTEEYPRHKTAYCKACYKYLSNLAKKKFPSFAAQCETIEFKALLQLEELSEYAIVLSDIPCRHNDFLRQFWPGTRDEIAACFTGRPAQMKKVALDDTLNYCVFKG